MNADAWAIAVIGVVLGLLGGLALALWHRQSTGVTGTGALEHEIRVQAAELRRMADQAVQRELTSEQLRAGMDGARRALDELRLREQERRGSDAEQRDVVRRLATVLAGGAAKGRAGENVLRDHLSDLPPGMLVTDFRVNGKVVEFGLALPDGRRLPIDSKWTALAELEALEAATDPVERDACARAVEKAVSGRVKEVAQYLDPAVTSPVAVAAVPDAAYAALKRAHADAYTRGVVVVPYGAALPIVLFLYALVQRFGDTADVQTSLTDIAAVLDAMEAVVENRFQKAVAMLSGGTDAFRSELGKARGSIARARSAGSRVADPASEDPAPLAVVAELPV
jgi:hypothetical protein